jgi:ribonuclease P protein component
VGDDDRTFRPAERISKRRDYTRVYETGVKHHGRLMTVFIRPSDGPEPRLGIAATRKLGPAVDRNRAKRRVRELFRHHKPDAGLDIVVVPRRELLDAPFASLEAEFRALLERRHRRGPHRPSGTGRPGRPRPDSGV